MFGPVGLKAAKIEILEVCCSKSKSQRLQILRASSAEGKKQRQPGLFDSCWSDEAITPSPAQPQPVIPVIVIMISEKPI